MTMDPQEFEARLEARSLVGKLLAAVLKAGSEWVSPKQLAKEMGLSERSVRNLAAKGRLPKPMIDEGKIKRWHRAQFLVLVDRRR